MVQWFSRHRRARAVLLVVVGGGLGVVVLGLVLAALGGGAGYDRVGEPSVQPWPDWAAPAPSTGGTPAPSPEAADAVEEDGRSPGLASLPDTDDPDAYAAAVARVLFGMDYAGHGPGDYEAFFEAALWHEIAADDRTRIMATISRRIPTADMWHEMRAVEQIAEFDVELVWEPRIAREHRDRGDWPDGWMMRTVSGAQTDTWREPGEGAQSSARPIAVTVAMACPPAASPCRLIGILPHVES